MSAITPEEQREDCQECLIQGLDDIGIQNAQPTDEVDFGAINSDDDCVTLAKSIEVCLGAKYIVAPLAAGYKACRAAASIFTVAQLTDSLVQQTRPR